MILLMYFIEYILQMHFFGSKFRNWVMSIRNAVNSFIKYKIGIATSFVNPILLFIFDIAVHMLFNSSVLIPLSTKAFFFQVLNVEMFHCCIIEFKPFTIVLRILISLFDIAVIVSSISWSRMNKDSYQLIFVLVYVFIIILFFCITIISFC